MFLDPPLLSTLSYSSGLMERSLILIYTSIGLPMFGQLGKVVLLVLFDWCIKVSFHDYHSLMRRRDLFIFEELLIGKRIQRPIASKHVA